MLSARPISQQIRRIATLWVIVLASAAALASPATFVTALPVAESQILARFNWNPTYGGQGFVNNQFPFDLAYGLNSRWTLFTTFNVGHTSLNLPTLDGVEKVSTAGWGDTLAFLRYTLYSRDKSTSTFRIAPLAGLYLPSGSNTLSNSSGLLPQPLQTGSGALAPYAGVAAGWNCLSYGFAADSTIRHNPIQHHGIDPGDLFRADAQGEVRLHPIHLPKDGLPYELWLSIEENYQHNSLSHAYGTVLAGSGGSSFYQDAVLEFATLRYEIGAGLQLPVVQDLNSPAALREKRQLIVFTEYYFSGFTRRTP